VAEAADALNNPVVSLQEMPGVECIVDSEFVLSLVSPLSPVPRVVRVLTLTLTLTLTMPGVECIVDSEFVSCRNIIRIDQVPGSILGPSRLWPL
jgi:hypothetical protein